MTSTAQTPWCQMTIAATKSQHVLTKQHSWLPCQSIAISKTKQVSMRFWMSSF